MTATTLAEFYGGPDDGHLKGLSAADLACGFIDTQDSFGRTVRYSVVPLKIPHPSRDGGTVTHRLIPAEVL